MDENFIVKISDFGLSRRIYSRAGYTIKPNALLPYRWMALEILKGHPFTPAADVVRLGYITSSSLLCIFFYNKRS